jgi:hypothetical protein
MHFKTCFYQNNAMNTIATHAANTLAIGIFTDKINDETFIELLSRPPHSE